MNDDRPLARIQRALGAPGLVDALARLPGADLQSLLLAVHRRRAAALDARDVLDAYGNNTFVQPSPVAPAALREIERRASELLPPGFEALDLSPVAPFGVSAVLGGIPQDWVVAAGRGTEVVSDPTAVLALECAVRRRALRQRGRRRSCRPLHGAASTAQTALRTTLPAALRPDRALQRGS